MQNSMTCPAPSMPSDPVATDVSVLLEALDLFEQGFGILDPGGRWIARNACLARLLEEGSVAEALRDLPGRAGDGLPHDREIATDGGPRRLRVRAMGDHLAVLLDPCSPTVPAEQLRRRYGLTRREATISLLLAEGRSNAEIAEALFISPHTARTHVARVLGKLGARSRASVNRILKEERGATQNT
jgi:DNA-binding CsgD family transcriptional regulator